MQQITPEMVKALIPFRSENSHKGTFGKLLCVCGSNFYRGAAALSVMGALRTGVGIVCLACDEFVIQSIASLIPEAIFLPLPNDSALMQKARDYNAMLLGCGKEEDNITFLETKRLLQAAKGTIVLDAGSLISCCRDLSVLQNAYERIIITPHMGEMAKLINVEPSLIAQNPQKYASSFALEHGVTVVLKSHQTVISSPDGDLFINRTGNAGLSRGGSGDILSGMIASFAAQGLSPVDSAVCGCYLHGASADITAKRRSMQAMLPHEILEDLQQLFLEMEL